VARFYLIGPDPLRRAAKRIGALSRKQKVHLLALLSLYAKGEERYRLERSYGAFRRTFALPSEVDGDKGTATFKKGLLTVTLPKTAQAATAKKIAVKGS
jgi:Hsp20/alpha crystallin family